MLICRAQAFLLTAAASGGGAIGFSGGVFGSISPANGAFGARYLDGHIQSIEDVGPHFQVAFNRSGGAPDNLPLNFVTQIKLNGVVFRTAQASILSQSDAFLNLRWSNQLAGLVAGNVYQVEVS